MDIQIIPSILEETKEKFDARYRAVSPHVQTVQLDVLDDTFLPNKNFYDPEHIDQFKPQIDFEVHFMIDNVIAVLNKWNYSWVKKIIFHVEANQNHTEILAKIKEMEKLSGVAINPETPFSKIGNLINLVDTVLVMTVQPGRNAAPFLPETIEKVREARAMSDDFNIEVDGGMSPKTIKMAFKAGANLFIAGSFIKNDSVVESIEELKRAI